MTMTSRHKTSTPFHSSALDTAPASRTQAHLYKLRSKNMRLVVAVVVALAMGAAVAMVALVVVATMAVLAAVATPTPTTNLTRPPAPTAPLTPPSPRLLPAPNTKDLYIALHIYGVPLYRGKCM